MPVLVRVKAAARTVQREVNSIAKQLASRSRSDLNKCLTNHLAFQLFSRIEKAFKVKSKGQTDELGYYWKPLSPKTIAARPITEKDERRFKIQDREKGLLTAEETRIWRGIFRSLYQKYRKEVNDKRAKYLAARSAWAILKARGAKTRIDLLSRRKVLILIVTERLLRSVSAGTLSGNRYYKPSEQIFEYENGELRLGSSVEYAEYVNKARRIIPSATAMVRGGWVRDSLKEAGKALAEVLASRLRRLR